MIIKRSAVESTGGFDEGIFMYGEDEDLCIRARRIGYEIERLPVTPVVHELGWGRRRRQDNSVRTKYRSLRYFVNKHYANQPVRHRIMLALLRVNLFGWRALLPNA